MSDFSGSLSSLPVHTALERWEGHLFEAVNRSRRVRCRTRRASSAGDQLGPEVQDVLWVRGSGLRCDGYSFRWLPVTWRVVRQRASTSVRAGGFQRLQRFERLWQAHLRVQAGPLRSRATLHAPAELDSQCSPSVTFFSVPMRKDKYPLEVKLRC